ncbi:MAG: hypothetical protein DCE86_18210 [Flavobacteriaceae bacterium]|jgi:hypothetical protein|uniref:hypothetical protein n=1 Tax=Flavobacterium sp. Leaf359 TaxID=1736351 RepID=UPI0006F7318B|nr:hypothetical protein [Flavobacterium sp. Leaf359]KQS53288.1 hypothetical protein ASG38_00700 [Flavobacterium sp. Leaf359]PZO22493.1 MAG: hypothetical protein DCE86_18210 [Flavobacteriaceae bacterium]
MEKRKIVYKEVQFFWLSIIPALLFLSFTIFAYLYKLGTKPIPLYMTIIIVFIFLVIMLVTYKMTIIIDDDTISISFGIGLIKKTINISNIDYKGIKKTIIPWYYGVGIRFGNGIVLYNTKSGKGIELPVDYKKYIISTKNYEQIKNIIIRQ